MTDIKPDDPYDPEVEGVIDFEDMVVRLDVGVSVPITNMFAPGGVETSDPVEAYALVAGPTPSGQWLNFDVDDDCLRRQGLIK